MSEPELQCATCVSQADEPKKDHCKMPHYGECAFYKRRSNVTWCGKRIDTLTQSELVLALEQAFELLEKQRKRYVQDLDTLRTLYQGRRF